jgi:hypothetical protein
LDKVKVKRNDLSDSDLEVVSANRPNVFAAPVAATTEKGDAKKDSLFSRVAGRLFRGETGLMFMRADFVHKPVMLAEVLAALRPKPEGRYVDGTLGGAGHAAALLAASSPTGWLFGCDRDGDALEAARERFAEFAGRFELKRGNFSELADWIEPGKLRRRRCWIWA